MGSLLRLIWQYQHWWCGQYVLLCEVVCGILTTGAVDTGCDCPLWGDELVGRCEAVRVDVLGWVWQHKQVWWCCHYSDCNDSITPHLLIDTPVVAAAGLWGCQPGWSVRDHSQSWQCRDTMVCNSRVVSLTKRGQNVNIQSLGQLCKVEK